MDLLPTVQSTHTVKIETAVKQLYKGQDYVEMIETVDRSTFEPFKAAILSDGHGSHTVPQMITRLAGQAVSAESPCTELQKLVCEEKKTGLRAIRQYCDLRKGVPRSRDDRGNWRFHRDRSALERGRARMGKGVAE